MALGGVFVFQMVANAEFWQSLTPEDNAAGAMMLIAELAQLGVAIFLGGVGGLGFALVSFRRQPGTWGMGLIALVFNALPFTLMLSFWLKAMLFGL